MTDQTPLGFSGSQSDGQQTGQTVSPDSGAQAAGAQAQYLTLDEARRMVQDAVAEALRQAQSHTDKSLARLSEQLASASGAKAQVSDGAGRATPAEQSGVSPERIEWANREAQRIYEQLGEVLTGADEDAPFRALLDESSPEAFIRTLPAAVIAKRMARGVGAQSEQPSDPAARAPALASGGMATRTEHSYDDIPALIARGMEQRLPPNRR